MMGETEMANEQYQGMLLDELEGWEDLLELAEVIEDQVMIAKIQKEIARINTK